MVEDSKWEKARKKRCINQFIKLDCCKPCDIRRLNAASNNFDITLLDVEKMKTLILDCVAALGIVQKEFARTKRPLKLTNDGQPLTKEEQDASNKVFVASLSTMATAMILDDTKVPKQSNGIERLLRAFPDYSKQIDGRSWLPLHWAVVVDEKRVTDEDVKTVYTSDPMALQRHHRNDSTYWGYTPAHLLCMRDVTQRNMSLIQYFSVCNPQAFTMSASDPNKGDPLRYSYSALHAACNLGQPTEELLKHLLQLDSSQTKKMPSDNGYTPLGYLSERSCCSDSLVACLLEVNSSAEVVGQAIRGCLASTDYSRVLVRVEMLLTANPEAAKYHGSNGINLLHIAARRKKLLYQACIIIMKRILFSQKDAVKEVDSLGWLPVHTAARHNTVEVMEFLLGLYPESASVITTDRSENLMHLAVSDIVDANSLMEAKVRLLCSRYPAMMLQGDDEGDTPLHAAICSRNISAAQILCEAGGQEQVRVPVAHPSEANFIYNGWLPLHFLINWNSEALRNSLFSKEADCFRKLLRSYPEAVVIESGTDEITPYQLAIDKRLPPYYLRLLLRAAPDLNPAELHRLNYAERRMATFLAFTAVTSQKKPVVLKRLCSENKDLVKHVISFL